MKKPVRALPAIVVFVFAGAAAAEEPFKETRSASRDGVVEISLLGGSLAVSGWNRAEVEVTGTLPGGPRDLRFFSEEGRTVVEIEVPEEAGAVDLVVRVPSGSEVRAESLTAEIAVREVTGVVVAESLSGAIVVEGRPAEVELSTASGAITVRADGLRRAEIGSIAGEVALEASPPSAARYGVETVSGNITLRLPGDVSAKFEAETFSGSIANELGPAAKKANGFLPAQELRFTAGAGSAHIMTSTVSGRITLARR